MGFVAKTQNLSVPDLQFDKFIIPSLGDFVGGDLDEPLLSPLEH